MSLHPDIIELTDRLLPVIGGFLLQQEMDGRSSVGQAEINKYMKRMQRLGRVSGLTFKGTSGTYSYQIEYVLNNLVRRGILPKFITDIGSNLLFGIFHFYAYSGDVVSIVIAVVFGFVFAFLRDRLGLMGSVGGHTAFNLKILGAF